MLALVTKAIQVTVSAEERAQHAADNRMLDESIQRFGRWTSNSFQLYFKTSPATLFHLNLSFQKGTPLAILRFMYQPALPQKTNQDYSQKPK